MATGERCRARTAKGEPCSLGTSGGTDYCFVHDPGRATQRKEWQRRGGRGTRKTTRAAKRIPDDMRGISETILRAIGDVESGVLTPAQAGAIATLSRAYTDIWQASELVLRLEELEAKATAAAAGR